MMKRIEVGMKVGSWDNLNYRGVVLVVLGEDYCTVRSEKGVEEIVRGEKLFPMTATWTELDLGCAATCDMATLAGACEQCPRTMEEKEPEDHTDDYLGSGMTIDDEPEEEIDAEAIVQGIYAHDTSRTEG